MIHLIKRMRKREWWMAGFCLLLVLGQIYFELKLPDYMSSLTSMIEMPESQGDHETLLAQGGFYATLYNSQFESTS